jgi:ankyrin repeat protein
MRSLSGLLVLAYFCATGPAWCGIPSQFYFEFGPDNRRAKEMKASAFFDSELQVEFAKAAAKGDTNRMIKLIGGGADINATGRNGMKPLFWALINRNFTGFKFLLERGANPNAAVEVKQPPNSNALTLAASLDEPEYLTELLIKGANPNSTVHTVGVTPLYDTVLCGKTNNITILLKYGAKLDWKPTNNETPLHNAIRQRNFEVALFLYRLGADPSVKDIWNWSPIDTLRKYKDNGVMTRKDRAAYKQLVEELQKAHLLDAADVR